MNAKILSIFTRTPLHVGCGSSVGAVDQPVTRERHTGYPVIPGSAIKGVLADLWLEKKEYTDKEGKPAYKYVRTQEGLDLLGNNPEDKMAKAGSLLVGEGRLLAFPVRSAKKCWAWITCPLALNRFARDMRLPKLNIPQSLGEGEVYASQELRVADKVIFEEYPLAVKNTVDTGIVDALKDLAADQVWQENLATHLAVVSDELFQYFVQNACEIANHNRINDRTSVVDDKALFAQENVPSEAFFYAVFNSKDLNDFEKLERKLIDEKYLLQLGADATTGLGWCSVGLKEVK